MHYGLIWMFVRWQLYRSRARNKRQRQFNDKHARLKAVLVEGERVEGKPRLRHIAFLGSTTVDAKDHLGFWGQVNRRLDQLGNRVTPRDRKRVVAAIAERLGEQPPTKAQLGRWHREREQFLAEFRAGFATPRAEASAQARRVISMRKANDREKKRFGERLGEG